MEHEKSPAHMRRTLLDNFILLFLGQGAHAVEAHPQGGQVVERGRGGGRYQTQDTQGDEAPVEAQDEPAAFHFLKV